MDESTGMPPRVDGPKPRSVGPCRLDIRQITVTETYAVMREMQFLNAAGQPASSGPFAWDRDRGRIYRVIDTDDRIIWILGRD